MVAFGGTAAAKLYAIVMMSFEELEQSRCITKGQIFQE